MSIKVIGMTFEVCTRTGQRVPISVKLGEVTGAKRRGQPVRAETLEVSYAVGAKISRRQERQLIETFGRLSDQIDSPARNRSVARDSLTTGDQP